MGVSKSATFSTIREFAADSQSISNMSWKLKRNGKGTETNYVLLPGKQDSEDFNWGSHEAFNLDKVIRELPYAEQEAFYFGFTNTTTSAAAEW
jgi:hypothetical protein